MIEEINEIIADLSSITDFSCQTNINKAIISLNNAKKIIGESGKISEEDEDKIHQLTKKCNEVIGKFNCQNNSSLYDHNTYKIAVLKEELCSIHDIYRKVTKADQEALNKELEQIEIKLRGLTEIAQNTNGSNVVKYIPAEKYISRRDYLASLTRKYSFEDEKDIYHQISVYYKKIKELDNSNATTYMKEESSNKVVEPKKEETKKTSYKGLIIGIVVVLLLPFIIFVLVNILIIIRTMFM